jgi:Uncharacterized protein conserved in bacteria (DUF2066)
MRFLPLAASFAIAFLSVAAAPPAKKTPGAPKPAPAAAIPGPVKGDPYSITVPVDATAASVSVAQNNAINGGRARAWTELSHRLVPQKDWAKLPSLDNAGLERLIRGYTVANEKRSTTRYVARITYIFNPGAVRHLFRVAKIGISEQPGTAVLLVAMSPTYSAHSPWAQALAQPKYASAQFPLVTPVGDAVDESSLGSLHFAEASWGQIQSAASRVHAGEAVLVQASNPAASHMTVRMRRVGPGKPMALADIDVPVAAGTPPQKAYATAAELAEVAIEDAWKTRGTIDLNKKSRMVAELRITSLEQWNSMLARLAAVPAISDVSVVAMNTGEGRVALSYTGTPDQLRTMAGQSNLNFAEHGGTWWISPGKPAADDTEAE